MVVQFALQKHWTGLHFPSGCLRIIKQQNTREASLFPGTRRRDPVQSESSRILKETNGESETVVN